MDGTAKEGGFLTWLSPRIVEENILPEDQPVAI
jgi:hypothetical protein